MNFRYSVLGATMVLTSLSGCKSTGAASAVKAEEPAASTGNAAAVTPAQIHAIEGTWFIRADSKDSFLTVEANFTNGTNTMTAHQYRDATRTVEKMRIRSVTDYTLSPSTVPNAVNIDYQSSRLDEVTVFSAADAQDMSDSMPACGTWVANVPLNVTGKAGCTYAHDPDRRSYDLLVVIDGVLYTGGGDDDLDTSTPALRPLSPNMNLPGTRTPPPAR